MTLLPKEFSGSNEGGGVLELPSDDVGPLVQLEGKVTVTLDPLGIGVVHDGFGGGSDSNGLLELGVAVSGDPGDFWGETFDVLLFLEQGSFGDEQGEVAVFDSQLLL